MKKKRLSFEQVQNKVREMYDRANIEGVTFYGLKEENNWYQINEGWDRRLRHLDEAWDYEEACQRANLAEQLNVKAQQFVDRYLNLDECV